MRELELESEEETKTSNNSDLDEDGDTCDADEIERQFGKCQSITSKQFGKKAYIFHIDATLEHSPNVALSLSNNTCQIQNLSNNEFAHITALSEHKDVISEVKFCKDNSNLVYTGSKDGTVRLWDLRTPKKSCIQFKDTSVENNQYEQITCFDISPNRKLLAAGTNLYGGDAFVMFWDVRKHSLLGGYWESHTDDITQVKFHPDDPNKLISGSVDGLINVYDLKETKEEDALIDSLNTESSIEKLKWLPSEVISCVTHTADVQLWKVEDAQPYYHLRRTDLAKLIRRDDIDYIYVSDVHATAKDYFTLAGSSASSKTEPNGCLRGLKLVGKIAAPALGFPDNKQTVRTSWFNKHTNLLLTGGENGILDAWEAKFVQ